MGMFKIHPKVPECMSDEAKGFIMSCFEPNPDNRAPAAELLMNIFLKSSGKKKLKVLQKSDSNDSTNSGEASTTLQTSTVILKIVHSNPPLL